MNPVLPYVISFLLNVLIAYSLSQICMWRNANTIGRGASVGVLLWIGFVGPITIVQSAITPGAQVSLPPHSVVTIEFDAPGVAATQP